MTLDAYVKAEGKAGRFGAQLMAVVAEENHGRKYLSLTDEQVFAARIDKPSEFSQGSLPTNPRWFSPSAFGMKEYSQLFTNRQLASLMTFCGLVKEVQQKAENDAVATDMYDDHIAFSKGGKGVYAYGEAIGVYLSFLVDKMADYHSSICSWNSTGEKMRNNSMREIMISTDSLQYDNIGYANLSDFFYVWMRQTLKDAYPSLFRTMLVSKVEEFAATPYRFDGSMERARDFFEEGMFHTCCQIHQYAKEEIPVTIYYAFKQSETDADDSTASTGQKTILSAIIRAGFSITGTWPLRTELSVRQVASGTNALASSIVLVCRKRPETASSVTRRDFINALHREMRPALEKLQSANIAPVDLAQSTIGRGIGVFSSYKSVLEADGTPMSVRAALQIVNQELDAFYNEQEGDLDQRVAFASSCSTSTPSTTSSSATRTSSPARRTLPCRPLWIAAYCLPQRGVRLLTREEIPKW